MNENIIPKHCAIIMDGNGRWAKIRNLTRPFGHKEGAKTTHNIVEASVNVGLRYLSLYVFSSENWQRPQKEVNALMKLLIEMIKKELPNLLKKNVKVLIMGDIELLPQKAKNDLINSIEKTSKNTGLVLCLAISYGGRNEIVRAAKLFARDCLDNKIKYDDLTVEKVNEYMYLPEIPYPELIIRTGGNKRISNFLLWQSAYSELYFTDTLWPDFNENELMKAFEQFSKTERRFGKVKDNE
ncbi:MAG: isoprenyl transferase [Chitinispirillales bacterium]|jgi:undecaprenyl diphosphate synthase|nr:isoprenyl transferase [Chitinispirillales bacterium]